MSRHLTDLLDDLKTRVARMSALVLQIVEQAIEAVLDADPELARKTIDADRRIDDEEVKVEQSAIDLLALHQPAAGDLRLITTVIKINSDLERIADCAVNVAQRVLPLAQDDDYEPPADLRLMCTSVVANLRDAVKAFNLLPPGAEPQHRVRMAMVLHTPALQAHSTLRYAGWRAVVAEHVARRTGREPEDFGCRLLAHQVLACCLAAYEQWLSDPEADLQHLLDEALSSLRGTGPL